MCICVQIPGFVCVLLGVFLSSALVWQQSGNHFSTKSSKQLHLGGILRPYLILTTGLGPSENAVVMFSKSLSVMAATTTCRLFLRIPVFNRNVSINKLKLGSPFPIQFMTNSFLHDVTVSVVWREGTFSPKSPRGSWLQIFLEGERFKSLQLEPRVESGSPCWVYLRGEDALSRRICQR